jgi:ligand-binding sensor domain-containing protein
MKKHYLQNQIYLFLLLFVGITSCNGQVKKNQMPNENINQQPKMARTQGVMSGNVRCELQDKAGNIWFSTSGEGVYRLDGKSFTNFTTKDGLNDNYVSAIIEDKVGNILFGTNKGMCKFNGKKFTRGPITDTLNITCLLEDKDGSLWFGTMENGIYRYKGATLTNFLTNKDQTLNLGNKNQLILDILQDKKGNIWFSSWNGGGVWRFDGNDFKNFLPSANYYKANEDQRSLKKQQSILEYLPNISYTPSQDYITDDMIFSITEDHFGNIWFATRRHGACRYNGKTFTSFRENEGFVSKGIYSILEDKKGNIWFSTDENGVFRYDGKVFKNFTTKDGLINNSVFSILEDKSGNFWFGTRGFGLSRFDGKRFTSYTE